MPTDTPTPEPLTVLRALADAATPGPWMVADEDVREHGAEVATVADLAIVRPLDDSLIEPGDDAIDAAFIVAAVNYVRAALADSAPPAPSEYGRLLAERDRLIATGADPADLDVPSRVTPEPGLTEAWAEAEAAVRAWDGTLLVGETNECKSCSGWWATASKRDPADRYPIIESSETGRPRGEHHDATPAAALLALAARLRETP